LHRVAQYIDEHLDGELSFQASSLSLSAGAWAMNPRLTIALCLAAVIIAPLFPASAAVPKVSCRKGDRVEGGLQGEVTAAEVASGANKAGFNCNTDLVGQYQGEGASWQLTAWKNCAYFDQRKGTNLKNPGTVVVDVSDPAHPTPTAYLDDPAMPTRGNP
jgi:hypothetical protein